MSEYVSRNTSSRRTVREDDSALGQLIRLQDLIEERKSAIAELESAKQKLAELDVKIAEKRATLKNGRSSSDLKSLLMDLLGDDTQDKDKDKGMDR